MLFNRFRGIVFEFLVGAEKSSPESSIYVLINGFTVSVQVVSSDGGGRKSGKILKKCLASGKKWFFKNGIRPCGTKGGK